MPGSSCAGFAAAGGVAAAIAQDLVDSVFAHFDDTCARSGIGYRRAQAPEDAGRGFFGRAAAYDAALTTPRPAISPAPSLAMFTARRVARRPPQAEALARYVARLTADAWRRSLSRSSRRAASVSRSSIDAGVAHELTRSPFSRSSSASTRLASRWPASSTIEATATERQALAAALQASRPSPA